MSTALHPAPVPGLPNGRSGHQSKKRNRDSLGVNGSTDPEPGNKEQKLTNGLSANTTLANGKPSHTLPEIDFYSPSLRQNLSKLYSASVCAKIWGIAERALNKSTPPVLYPEYTKPGSTKYVYREADFWTSGFFPGSLYLLLERQRKFGHLLEPSPYDGGLQLPHGVQLEYACKWWTTNLHKNALVTGTHDLGFMISPWARKAWELDHDTRAYDTCITAAKTLGARFNEKVQALRSWDTCVTKRYSFTDPSKDYLVIIDNMLNLDLLFWASLELRSPALRASAIAHARTTQAHHIRPDSSTYHVVNFNQSTGTPKEFLTNQGYSDDSCWSRGQAWAITGFAETHRWTRDISFLDTSRRCADYFLAHLPEDGVPYWDFSPPMEENMPTDTSAAMIAVYGMLLLHEALMSLGEKSAYLNGALYILQAVLKSKMAPEARFCTKEIKVPTVETEVSVESGPLEVDMGEGEETILVGATINNYQFAPRRWADHGLVYADYYFLLVGNKLLEMGIGGQTGC
ncbi:glycoside hydrolase family 88 protein [Cadophora sp. MPI-SDFR-AT-0126]|nr:glycoside hydrolase family 88 protein [Leotiomycetes sp. MPI-SDFR-AT-0126]